MAAVSAAVVAVALGAAPALATATVPPEGNGGGGEGLTVIETLGLFVLVPLAIFAIIALAVLGPSLGRGARHRTGAPLDSGPVWVGGGQGEMDQPVLGDPGESPPTETHRGVGSSAADPGARGGASGRW